MLGLSHCLARRPALARSLATASAAGTALELPAVQEWIRQRLAAPPVVTQEDFSPTLALRLHQLLVDTQSVPPTSGLPAQMSPMMVALLGHGSIPESQLGADGYDASIQPPAPFRRLMWTGQRLEWSGLPTLSGARQQPWTISTRVSDVQTRQGRSGPSVWVHLEKTYALGKRPVARDTRVFTYLLPPDHPPKPVATGSLERMGEPNISSRKPDRIYPSAVSLFRFSALTYNAHKIHYDPEWAAMEGYPGMLVHGPLQTTLLVGRLQSEGRLPEKGGYEVQAVSPAFVGTGLGVVPDGPGFVLVNDRDVPTLKLRFLKELSL